jgi:large subunit ribosomal protein L21
MSGYAIISLGGKQYRVQEGERLLVDRLKVDEGTTLEPRVLLLGGNGAPDLAPSATVTARVVGHELGEKIRIGKYKKRTGYKKHIGHRSRLTRIEIETIGGKAKVGSAAGKAGDARPKDSAAADATAKAAAAKPKAEKAEPKAEAAATGIDVGSMTIADISQAVAGWSKTEVEAALAAEQSGKARKGAIAALESALKEKS